MTIIYPSILSADLLCLKEEIARLESTQADGIHVDVMDGSFVPNLTFGPWIIKAIKKVSKLPLDIHLMINNPEETIDWYLDLKPQIITVHPNTCLHLDRIISHIQSKGVKAGVALNPSTHENSIRYVADKLDLVLVMSVNPGFSGQKFIPSTLDKISAVCKMLQEAQNHRCLIAVDGGIDNVTAKKCLEKGANMLISGSFIFSHQNLSKAISLLKESL